MEGAGVRLRRAFGFGNTQETDPFLLLDDFRNDNPADYLAGFPWHPHRGIETITYVLAGSVDHGDSLGNSGVISSGDVQWMTAGSGIIHQEMPKGREDGLNWGFQLWANLPRSHKMMEPRYRDITGAQIPVVRPDDGVKIGVVCGNVGGVEGPARDIVIDPQYLDVSLSANKEFTHAVPVGHTVFAYVIEGGGFFDRDKRVVVRPESLVVYGDGDEVTFAAGDDAVRFLLVSGRPLGEPVVWGGPIVMNTREELQLAFEEYQNGTFLKHHRK